MGCFDDLNVVLEVHHHQDGSGEARAFLLRSAATSTDCGPKSWLLSLFELKDGSLVGAWSGGWPEDDVDDLRDLMPDATDDVFAKRVGGELADGGAFLEAPTKPSTFIKLKIQDPSPRRTLRPFVVKLQRLPESVWLSGMTALAADAVKTLARQRTLVVRRQSPSPPPARKVAPSPVAFSSQLSVPATSQSRLSIEEQRTQLLEREIRQLKAARAEAASQSPVKSQTYIDHTAGRPKGMSIANPNVKEARPTNGGPFDSDTDESDDDVVIPFKAGTSKLSPDGDGSVTDPGSTAAVTPASTKGEARATLIGSETESNSEGEATLGSPTKRKSKPASSVLRPGSSPARHVLDEPESFAKTLHKTNAKRPLSRLYSDGSSEDGSEPAKRAASKKARAPATARSAKNTAAPLKAIKATASRANDKEHDFDDDDADSQTESD